MLNQTERILLLLFLRADNPGKEIWELVEMAERWEEEDENSY